jgi:subtilase family serine protease
MKYRRLIAMLALPCAALLIPHAGHAGATDVFSTAQAPAGVLFSAVADAEPMSVVLSLPLRDQAGAARYADAVSDPASAHYGHFLTPAQFGARFGGDAAAYASLRRWATANGLTIGKATEGRIALSLSGTAGEFARLFHTNFARFETKRNGEGRVTLSTPRLPTALIGRVNGVIGLSSGGHYAPLVRMRPAGGPRADVGTGLGGGYSPTDIRTAYDIPAQISSAKTEVVGLFEQGGYKTSDITTYETQYGVSVPQKAVSVNGASTKPNTGIELEADLDIDAIMGTNPNASQILIYEDGQDAFNVALLDALQQMASDDIATVISISYGLDESQQGTAAIQAEGQAFEQLAIQGQSVFVSSGDDGAAGRTGSGLNAPDPGSQPYVTSVGGTTLNTNSTQHWASETVWNDLAIGYGATGGGVSSVWSIPSYQLYRARSVALANGGSATMRNVPDVAADADPYTAYSVYCSIYGGWISVGGTSLASPLLAGMTTVANADRVAKGGKRLGFLNPALYHLGLAATGFHDITVGNNGTPGYTAGPGYDNDTGFGSVDFAKLLSAGSK